MTFLHFASVDVLIWAFSGGLVHVLSRLPATGELTQQWLASAFARLVVRTLIGIASIALLPATGFGPIDLHAIASVSGWAVAFAVASSDFVFGRRWTH